MESGIDSIWDNKSFILLIYNLNIFMLLISKIYKKKFDVKKLFKLNLIFNMNLLIKKVYYLKN